MPRHTFLDAILNRPSQSYAAGSEGNLSHAQQQRSRNWSSPPDLPNAPRQHGGSILGGGGGGGSLFKRKSKANLSTAGSDAGTTSTRTTLRSRFSRKKRESFSLSEFGNSQYAPSNADDSMQRHHPPPPSSVADSQATGKQQRKGRWWEAGGAFSIGRRSRAPSIAGDSIFSEPDAQLGTVPWNAHGLAGIGAGRSPTSPRRASRSDYGSPTHSRLNQSSVPPVPSLPPVPQAPGSVVGSSSGRSPGRLQTGVAPLGASTLNPTLQRKPSKGKASTTPILPASPPAANTVRKTSSSSKLSTPRAMSPPPSVPAASSMARIPGALASSPHVRRLSQDGKTAFRADSSVGAPDGSDWKDFVKSLSGSEISKTWAGTPNAPDMHKAAVKGLSTANVERRKSHYERVAKELQQDAQFEQTVRDPGVVHQDLLARAASQVVGSPPPGLEEADYIGHLQPGSVIIPPNDPRHALKHHQRNDEQTDARQTGGSGHSQLTMQNMQHHTAAAHQQHVEDVRRKTEEEREAATAADTTEESEESSEDDEDGDGSEQDSVAHKQTMLEAVREEDEDANSSVGADSRRQTLVLNDAPPSTEKSQLVDEQGEPRYKAFAAALNKSRFSGSHVSGNESPNLRTVPLAGKTSAEHDAEEQGVKPDPSNNPRIEVSCIALPDDVCTPEEKQTHTSSYHSDGGGNASEDNEVYQDARSSASDTHVPRLTEDVPAVPALPLLSMHKPATTSAQQLEESEEKEPREVMADDESDEADRRSNQSGQTGRVTVTFDTDTKSSKDRKPTSDETVDANGDARSTRSSITRGSRPATLQRRLSDLSLGTSFGVSNFMRIGQSRSSSSRRMKMNDDDHDSAGSNSDGDDNDELRARIKTEQDRLRNMKVGDDFFGGSLSELLDKFDNTNWDERESSGITQQLDLDIGSAGLKSGDAAALATDQDVLNKNAQERILEVRRMRSDGGTPSKRRQELSETRTVESGIAPSFAALWLLNQAGEVSPSGSKDDVVDESTAHGNAEEMEVMAETDHKRTGSMGSSDDKMLSMTHNSPSSRLRNFFSGKDSNAASSSQQSPEKQTTSVLNRPRQRTARPKEMGGVSIAQGKLAAETKEDRLEDARSTLPSVWTAQTLSQMKEAKEQQEQEKALTDAASTTHGSEAAVSPPSSPIAKVPSSKDKPAPLKSSIKGGGKLKNSKSLADTLFSFAPSTEASSKTKLRTRSEKSADSGSTVKGKGKQVAAEEEKVAAKEEKQATPHEPAPVLAAEREASPKPEVLAEPSTRHVEAVHAPLPVRAEQYPIALQSDGNDGEAEETMRTRPTDWQSNEQADTLDLDTTRSPPPNSEHWSGESVVSTGPITPGASDILDHRGVGILPRRGFSPAYLDDAKVLPASPRDKKLPLPPVPTFEDETGEQEPAYAVYEDQTPLAITRNEPAYTEYTPRAERDQPSFGLNLIPPTPPAEDAKYTLSAQLSDMPARTPPTLDEEDEDPLASAGAAVARQGQNATDLQHSTSSRSKKSDAGLTRKSSTSSSTATKRRSNVSSGLGEYQAQGLSLPPGLVATTVATSSSRQQDYPISADPTAKSRKSSKGKKSKKPKGIEKDGDATRPFVAMAPQSALSSGSAPMQQSLSASLASLAPPHAGQSDTGTSSSSRGSDSMRLSASSPGPSPAVSLSGRSTAVSSSAASDTSSSRNAATTKHTSHAGPPRSIRTTTVGPNGHARTSMMSAISEWESSPVDEQHRHSPSSLPRSGYASPVPYAAAMMPHSPSGYASPTNVYASPSYATRSQSSLQSGSSPSVVRNAPIGAPTDAMLQPSAASAYPSDAGANRRLSVPMAESADGHQGRGVYGGSYLGHDSEYSLGMQSEQSVLSLPAVPQSSYRARDPLKAFNTIDDRLYAKTTMSTISVTSGAFRKGSRSRRPSIDPTLTAHVGDDGGAGGLSRRASMDTVRDQMMVEELHRTTMSMTSHTPPPRKLSSSQVLVQVIACAIDDMDRLLLRERVRNDTAYGFVPGRSFCGRVMETGWEVKRMRKGDIIFGLQTSRKCGALAEFMTIEESLTAKAPQDCLTMEQIAALPSVGVVAHQLMINHCSQLKRGSRILILNAHDGVGLLTMQECASLGLIIVAHCPNQVSDGVAICEANGAHEVIIGEPLWALNSLHESSFDMVVDTVGGRRVYDAARRILAFEGQFCTSIGDLQSAVANPNLRSHLRSLRRSFFKKDTKHIGYEWVGTDTAEDCREALEAVQRAAESGLICPRLKSVLAFAEAPRAFENTLRNAEEEPGAVVVRIS